MKIREEKLLENASNEMRKLYTMVDEAMEAAEDINPFDFCEVAVKARKIDEELVRLAEKHEDIGGLVGADDALESAFKQVKDAYSLLMNAKWNLEEILELENFAKNFKEDEQE